MKDILKKDGFLLALFPVLAFICAFLFELGYAYSFGYSYTLIEIDLKGTVVSLFCTVVVLFPVLFVFFVFVRFGLSDSTSKRVMALPLVYFMLCLILCCVLGFQSKFLNWLLLIGAVYAIGYYLAFAVQIHRLGWELAVSATAKRNGIKSRKYQPSTSEPLDFKNILKLYLCLVTVLLVVGLMIRGVGIASANWKSNYQVITIDEREYAVLSVYGDLLVLGGIYDEQFDRQILTISRAADRPREFRSAYLPRFLSVL